jgi:hypothetical protein
VLMEPGESSGLSRFLLEKNFENTVCLHHLILGGRPETTAGFDFWLDEAILKYSQIASLPKPRKLERKILEDWINRPSLGGGCGFLGRDLREFNNQPTVYDAIHMEDLAILSDNHGEDDLFTRFVTGPLLMLYHQTWGLAKVSPPIP